MKTQIKLLICLIIIIILYIISFFKKINSNIKKKYTIKFFKNKKKIKISTISN